MVNNIGADPANNEAARDAKKTAAESDIAAPPPSEDNKDSGNPNKCSNKPNDCLDIFSAVMLLLAFLAAAAAAWEARRLVIHGDTNAEQQHRDTLAALAAARNANEIAIRPYIKITALPDSFAIKPPPNGSAPVMTLGFKIENTGKLPAPARIQSGAVWESENHGLDLKDFGPGSNQGQIFLFPQQDSEPFFAYGPEITDGNIVDLKRARYAKFYATIIVWYGPEGRMTDYETQICSVYPIIRTSNGFSLGRGERCPQNPEYNHAK